MKIQIKLTPRSKSNSVEKIGDLYHVKVTEPPIENRANFALIDLMAKELKLPKSSFRFVSGTKSKLKTLEVLT